MKIYNNDTINNNYRLTGYCQNEEFSKILFNYFTNLDNKIVKDIIYNNKYKDRYNNNNDTINNTC